jgi:hypothetical protein
MGSHPPGELPRWGSPPSGTLMVMKAMTWPTLKPEDQWLTTALEKQLLESNQTAEELRAEARRLRAEAAQRELKASRDALLAAAANYELVAAERLAAA